ncbi:ATP-dependent nuclease [Dyella humicola]|uniref:ATP-dependent nuclease n=1 Tax=Dyella humicola TaxID=2992126 RepID=UPI002252CF86|nr:AAA family ATPase [Dyella humicola]
MIKLHVKNFRSVKDSGEFDVTQLFALVGENNTGKSNLLRAIEVLLSAGSGKVGKDDFFDQAAVVVIKGTFTDLTQQERLRWRPYLIADQLILEKHISLTLDDNTGRAKAEAIFHGYQAEPSSWFLSIPKIQERLGDRPKWQDVARENGLPDYFLEDGKSNKTIYVKALARFLLENEVDYDEPDLKQTQALGLQSNVIAALPRVYLLPAITDYSDEIDRRSSTSTFRRLMAALSDRLLQRDPRFIELQTALATIRSLLNPAASAGGVPRIQTLDSVENKITELLRRVMPTVQKVSFAVEIDEVQDLFSAGVSLSVDDGMNTDVLAKGHGLQRCVVFTLLQTLILNERNRLVENNDAIPAAPESPIILLVEEPELYIHPQLAKLLYDVLSAFSLTDQAIYTTHSSFFIDAYDAEKIAIISKLTVEQGTLVRGCDKSAFDGLDDRKLFKGFTMLNPAMNDLFFAKKVMLVEGPEDIIAVTATLKALGRIVARVEELGWSVIACGGKDSIPFFQRVLNAFSIPYAVIHDLDIHEGMKQDAEATHKKTNDTIAMLSQGAPIHAFPVKLERSLGLDRHFGDQYAAHLFFSESASITQEVMDLISGAFA